MKRTAMFAAIAALCVATILPTQAAELRFSYDSPFFRMGSSANDSESTLTTTPQLAFADMTLADVAALVDDGYSFGATQCGTSWANLSRFHARDVLVCRNPDTDAVSMISVLFVGLHDGHTKSFAIELTDGDGGVYARAGRSQYLRSTNNTSFQFVIPNGNGGVIYSCDTSNAGKASEGTIAAYNGSGYGFCSLTLAKIPKTSVKIRAFANAPGEPALTVQDLRNYSFSSRFCGHSIAIGYVGTVANGYNKTIEEDGEGRATKLTIDFQTVEGTYTKCVVLEFTDGADGVYAQAVKSLHANKSTLPLGSPSTSDGWTDHSGSPTEYYGLSASGTTDYGLFTLNATAPAQPEAYKMLYGSNQHILDVTTLPLIAGSWVKVFDGVTLQDIKDGAYELSCWLCGGSVGTKQRVLAKGIHYFTPEGENSVSNALCTFVIYDTGRPRHTKAATILLENRVDGVYAKYGKGQYLNNQNNVNFNFAWLDEDGNPVYECNQASHTASGNNDAPASWTATGYGVAGLAAHKYMAKNVSNLVWANPAGEPVLTLDDIKDYYFGCYCSGASFSVKDREGIGLHRAFEYDQGGSVTSMRVEFQTCDDRYVKCVVVNFTNGVDGVYGTAVAACHSPSKSYSHTGYQFYNASGVLVVGEDSVATNTAVAYYGIYELFAAPMVTLTRDTDWSGRGSELSLGGAVVNLNGHRLTIADGVSGDATAYAKIVNTNSSTLAELRVKPSGWTTINNSTVCFGKSALDTDNIKFVKDGKGTYSAVIAQEYKGGTEFEDGILKVGIAGTSKPFGTATTTITIPAGCVFDANGQMDYGDYSFVLNGGEIRNTGTDRTSAQGQLKTVSLTADSSFVFPHSYGLIGTSYAATTLDLAGHTLAVDVSGGKAFFLCNATVSHGTIELQSAGDGRLLTGLDGTASANGTNHAETVDFKVGCALWLYAPLNVRNYEALFDGNSNNGMEAVNVFGVFKPSAHDRFHGCRMMDGSTIDLSLREAALPLVSAFTNENSDRTLKFANGATVYVKLDGKRFPQGKVISWESKPENIGSVKFRCVEGERSLLFVAKDDGLYATTGFLLIVR
ncbi:MAG: hypothetical protein J6T51_05615 [Kiritimatiellae bacterium]|nr:hypothetical protein [Kiritimatiellia bacterium]